MNSKVLTLAALIFALLVLSACKANDALRGKNEGFLAKVNGVAITEDDLNLRLQGGHAGNITPRMREQALEALIDEELLYQNGVKLGLDKDAKYRNALKVMEARMKAYKRSEMARMLRGSKIASSVNVTNEDVKKYFTEHEAVISTDLHLLGIRFPDEEQARTASERMKTEPFEAVAREKFTHAAGGKTTPWDMGFLHWNQIPIEWVDAVYALKKGEVSGVLSSQWNGIYIVKLVDRRKNPDAALERVSAGIMNRLVDMRSREAYSHYLGELKREARIVKPEERRKPS
jgi:parvulin-like peptidyl-prolyl isomerase